MADFGDGAGDLRGAVGGTLDIARDFLGGGALFLDRGRDRGGDLGNLADGRADHLDRADRLLGRGLHARDLDTDFVGGLGGLGGQRLDLLRDHGKAAAGFAGARRLDGGVEREKLVCSATDVISLMTSPIRLAACDSALMRESVSSAWATALAAMRLDSWTCAEISRTELASSSVAAATDCTLLEASSEALATTVASRVVLPALSLSARAVPSSSLDAVESVLMMARKRSLASAMVFFDFGGWSRNRSRPRSRYPAPRPWRWSFASAPSCRARPGRRGQSGERHFVLRRPHQLVADEHLAAADIPLRRHAGAGLNRRTGSRRRDNRRRNRPMRSGPNAATASGPLPASRFPEDAGGGS